MTQSDIWSIAFSQHATDMNCRPEDFTCGEPVAVISKANEGARAYLKNYPFFLDIACYGPNLVASVDPRIEDFSRRFICADPPYACFEPQKIMELNQVCEHYGMRVKYFAQYWLPDLSALHALPCRYEMQIMGNRDFTSLYVPEWSYALCEERKDLDVCGVGVYDKGKMIAMAACSADGDQMWQIGIDVLPEYRRQGIAAAATSRLALEILKRDKVPFYCCSWANFPSARNAYKSGFRPAWSEMTAVPIEIQTVPSQGK
jgi:GNAT superfamily N-acetyltransferase